MYRHRPPQPGSQPFSGGPRPPRPPHRGPAPNIRGPPMNFQFPRPTQLPKELESALTIQGSRDMDHRTMDHRNRPNQHQGYSTNQMTSDNRTDQHQGADWSKYQPPNKLFAGPQPSSGRETENRAPVTNNSNWGGLANESQPRNVAGDGPGLYTSESAGSILASFGLSNEDLEVLSHYPDDQLTPDTLPFILRDIQINKSAPKTSTSTASSAFSSSNSDVKQCSTLPSTIGHSNQEVPSLLTVTQTAGKVIDYGHASRAGEDNNTRTTFKREQLSGERVVKILPSSSPPRKVDKPESRLVQVERGDKDYRKLSTDDRKGRSPGMEKARNLDRDYRREHPAPRTSSETRSESSSSKRSVSSSTGTKSHNSSKKLPTAAMISDFSAHTPKVFPYTCSLCHMQCDQEKDWDDHLNTVNHTAACRELRNKYPQWKTDPSRSDDTYHERYTSHSSASRSRSRSPVHRSPHSKYIHRPHYYKSYRRSRSPHESHHYHHRHHHGYTGGSSSYRSVRRPYDFNTKHYTNFREGGPVKHGPSAPSYRSSSPETKAFKTTSGLSCKPPPAKKKKKLVSPSSEEVPKTNCLLYLTGIPLDATEEEVTDLVGSHGVINNVILLPCTEEERQRGEGQKASVCMVRGTDAQALAESTNLFIREKPITVTQAKVPEEESPEADSSTPAEEPGSEQETDKDKQKALILITGLPEGNWSKSDIEQLIKPFGPPSDIIVAETLGKAMLSVPDSETAEEIEKFHNVMPAKIQNAEIKVIHLKWHQPTISMKTPSTLYNLLMGRRNPLFDGPVQASWNRLLVISNVPPSGHSDVAKLVRRFGTVIKTLPLHDVLICEMASAKMAVSVNRRFMNFPCILQNNPLSFSRWPDPKITTEPLEEKKTAKTKLVKKKTDPAVKALASEENGENEAQEDDTNQEEKMEDEQQPPGDVSAAATETEVEVKDEPATLSDAKEAVQELTSPPNDTETPPGGEQPNTQLESEGENVAENNPKNEVIESKEELQSEVKEEMKPAEVQEEENQAAIKEEKESEAKEEKQDDTKEKGAKEKEAKEKEAKRLKDARERERKEKEARERRIKEREKERREKERRTREERLKREREEKMRREKEKRELERRDKERRERKRMYEDHRRSSRHMRRDEDNVRRRSSSRVEEEEEDFPFNLGDFVTVDEVGEVGELSEAPPPVPMETNDAEVNGSSQQDVLQETQKDNMSGQPAATVEANEGTMASDSTVDRSLPPVSSPSPAPQSEPPQAEPPQAEPLQAETLQDELPQDGHPKDEPLQDEPLQDEPLQDEPLQDEPLQDEPPQDELPQDKSQDEPSHAETSQDEPLQDESPQVESSNQLEEHPSTDSTPTEEQLPAPPQVEASVSSTAAPAAAEEQTSSREVEKETSQAEDQTMATETESAEAQSVRLAEKLQEPSAEKESTGETPTNLTSLPPYNPSTPVGLEFLVPKTGFFCKPCNRFFTGNREFEITHCKSLKHYQNLQEFLKRATSS